VAINEALNSLGSTIARDVLDLFDSSESIELRMGLRGDLSQPVRALKGQGTGQLIPADEVRFVVGHVKGSEESAHQVRELVVAVMHEVIFVLAELNQVVEGNGIALDTDLLDELSEFAISSLTKISKETVLKLRLLLHGCVGVDLLRGLIPNDMLVTEHFADSALIEWHALLLSEVHGVLLVHVAVLEGKVLGLAQLSELLEEGIVSGGIHDLLSKLLAIDGIASPVADHMHEGTLLIAVKTGQDVLKLRELFLFHLMSLVFSLRKEVQLANEVFELRRFSVDALHELRVEVFLIVELCNLRLKVSVDFRVGVPIFTSQLLEEIVCGLAALGCWVLRSLCEMERQGEKLLLVRRVQVELIDGVFVCTEAFLSFLLNLFVGTMAWNVGGRHLVYELLNRVGVSVGSSKLTSIAEGDVFETVDLTKRPEDGACILAEAAHLEHFGQVCLLGDAADHMVKELRLREGIFVVHRQVVEKLVLR